MVYDRHPQEIRGVALLSTCMMKGRKVLPIFIIIIRSLRPISPPGDRILRLLNLSSPSPFQGRGSSFIFMLLSAVVIVALLAVRSLADLNVAYVSYYNDFIEPGYVLEKNWSRTTVVAQQSIIQWADWLAAQGPWCTHIPYFHLLTKPSSPDVGGLMFGNVAAVTTSKTFLAPSNDTHDYLSWAR